MLVKVGVNEFEQQTDQELVPWEAKIIHSENTRDEMLKHIEGSGKQHAP